MRINHKPEDVIKVDWAGTIKLFSVEVIAFNYSIIFITVFCHLQILHK